MVKIELEQHWNDYELKRGKILTIREVSLKTGLSWDTVKNLKEGKQTRFDEPVLHKICDFFGFEPGQPVPFLIYTTEPEAT